MSGKNIPAYDAEKKKLKELKKDSPFNCGYIPGPPLPDVQSPTQLLTKSASKEWLATDALMEDLKFDGNG